MKNTKLLTTSEEDLKIAAEILKNDGTVIFPTETVYGLGANALSERAVAKIFEAKGRPGDNPLIVHVDSFEKVDGFVKNIPENAIKLANAFWPGPMTLIMEKKNLIPENVSAGLTTVGIRIPKSLVARHLIELAGVPVAAPSANLSGSPSPTTSKHVIDDMMGRVDAIISGDDCEVGLESTVIDATGNIPEILRPGGITADMVEDICGSVVSNKNINGVTGDEKPKSPGMKYRHYAPKADVILIEDERIENIIQKVKNEIEKINNKKVVILCTDQTQKYYDGNTLSLGDRNNPKTIAHNLFEVFRKCDELGFEIAIAEGVNEDGIGYAIMNRMRRAAKKG